MAEPQRTQRFACRMRWRSMRVERCWFAIPAIERVRRISAGVIRDDCGQWDAGICGGWRSGDERRVGYTDGAGGGERWPHLCGGLAQSAHSGDCDRMERSTRLRANGVAGYAGDGGPATAAELSLPRGLMVTSSGAVIFADSNNQRMRMVDASGTITTIAGNGVQGAASDGVVSDDGGDELAARGCGCRALARRCMRTR